MNIRTAFTSRPTLRNILTHVKKQKQPEEKLGVIYQIPCECGAVYIGETGRAIKQRKAEHKRAVMKADPSNAVALHTASTLHAIRWEECKVIVDQESNWGRRIKEAIYIEETPNTRNTDPGLLYTQSNLEHPSTKVVTSSSQDYHPVDLLELSKLYYYYFIMYCRTFQTSPFTLSCTIISMHSYIKDKCNL